MTPVFLNLKLIIIEVYPKLFTEISSEVVTAPYQFSWTFQKTSFIPAEPGSLEDSMGVALKAITSKDFTQGSTFYHRTDVSPRWAAHKNFTAQYGSHKFYRQAGASVPPLPF